MSNRILPRVALLSTLALALAAAPAMAQGNGKGKGADDRAEARRGSEPQRPQLQRREVPPGWCQGRGNPHNTVENCGYRSDLRDDDSRIGRGDSYAERHADFHRYLDQKYSALASRDPLDIRRQLELRAQKSAEHERWHEQTGTRH